LLNNYIGLLKSFIFKDDLLNNSFRLLILPAFYMDEKYRLRVFEKTMLRKVFGPKRDKVT
jgi:hypothetical protein